ncbi:MAG: IMPACT family protein [Bacteroidales bacterium]|nr:IMPACT family protein [Bacteroidales bacterium]
MEKQADTYKTITKLSQGFFKDKGSKFYAFAYPVENEDQAKQYLDEIKKQYYDARHHCYAYAIGFERENNRMNDDGEPSGSAGKPIFGQILSYGVTNVLMVVTRYFGGVKLGIRGLINAYKYAASDALENSHIITRHLKDVYELHYDYPMMNRVMYVMKEENLEQLETRFEADCRLTFAVRKKDSQRVYARFNQLHPLKITFQRSV